MKSQALCSVTCVERGSAGAYKCSEHLYHRCQGTTKRTFCSHEVIKTPARSTYCPCLLQADTAMKGNPSNSNPPVKKFHRNPIGQQHNIKAAQSLRVQLPIGTGTSPVRLGAGSWITVWLLHEEDGAPPPTDCSRSDLHTSTGKKGAKTAVTSQLWWSPDPGEDVVIT